MSWTATGNADAITQLDNATTAYNNMSSGGEYVTVVDQATVDAITSNMQTSQAYATNAFTSAQSFLTQLRMSASGVAPPTVDPNFSVLALNIAQFDKLIGSAPANPANSFAFTEIPYSSSLLTDLRAALLQWVDGKSTGLLPSVEQAIWDRGRARETATVNRKVQEVIRQGSMRGFPRPPGELFVATQEALQESQNTMSSLSRDVMIKQAELEQSNRRFSLEQATKMEEAMIAYTSQQAARVLESAKALQTFLVDIYQHEVSAYGVQAQVYKARVDSETTAYKAQADVQVAQANVRVEMARIQLQTFVQELTLNVEVAKAGAQVTAQLAAAALSAISVHTQASSQYSNSASNSTQLQASSAQHVQTNLGVQYSYAGTAGAG
jgi:hypothetical protein